MDKVRKAIANQFVSCTRRDFADTTTGRRVRFPPTPPTCQALGLWAERHRHGLPLPGSPRKHGESRTPTARPRITGARRGTCRMLSARGGRSGKAAWGRRTRTNSQVKAKGSSESDCFQFLMAQVLFLKIKTLIKPVHADS